MGVNDISPRVMALAAQVEAALGPTFRRFDQTAEACTKQVMAAFEEFRVSEACFAGTTGYGYDDLGRETLDKIYARVFGAEKALVRIGFVNGTHALTTALFGVCRPGETLLSVTGSPYDTLQCAIGISGDGDCSLKYYGTDYQQVDLKPDGEPDLDAIRKAAANEKICAVLIQRSRGYGSRRAFSVADIEAIVRAVREVNPKAAIMVDNCYGEFTEPREPLSVGVDLIAGSLIKNPGGGLAPTGGYIAGRSDLVERAAKRMTTPGIEGECGCTIGTNRALYQGFFLAPHVVAQALKTTAFCAGMLEALGYKTSPAPTEDRHDIIQMIEFGDRDKLLKFCAGIQHGSPVDSYVTPVPWAMPGYDDEVVMAAGAFIQGSSIELSCDGPIRAPYIGYMQGGLTYESGKLGVMTAVSEMLSE